MPHFFTSACSLRISSATASKDSGLSVPRSAKPNCALLVNNAAISLCAATSLSAVLAACASFVTVETNTCARLSATEACATLLIGVIAALGMSDIPQLSLCFGPLRGAPVKSR